MSIPLRVFQPWQLDSVSDPIDFSAYAWRFLAEGDSWFSIGTLNPAKNSNLLFQLEFSRFACAINCATHGDSLSLMSVRLQEPLFTGLLNGPKARRWQGILMSAGGNDLIHALRAGHQLPHGDPQDRLLRPPAEWGSPFDGVDRYISEPGWTRFVQYIRANLDHVLALRDAGPSVGQPVFLHTYAYIAPRFAPAVPGGQAWIAPALKAYGIPQGDWTALSHTLIGRLAQLLVDCSVDSARYPNLYVFDSTDVPLLPASHTSTIESGDWLNETHLRRSGYDKLAQHWARAIEAVLTAG